MNTLQVAVITAVVIFLLLLPIRVKWALVYARYVVLTAVACLVLLPFFWLLCAAIKDKSVLNTYVFLPPLPEWSSRTINLDNFRELFRSKSSLQGDISFWRYVINSLFLSSASTVIALFFSSLGGYALAKYQFPGRRMILTFMLASMTIPGISLMAPTYELIYKLGWLDTYWSLLVPGAVSVFGIFLFRQAITGIPDDLIEAGRIDGCSEFRIYLQLVMPLVRPMTGAFCLVTFLGSWNAFTGPNVLLTTQAKMTLPVIINQYVGEYQQHYGVFLAGTLIAIIPPALLFLALQREFISGLTTGAVKQ